MENLQVMVIGAGTGGLALAHGLRASGISVRVFERDHNLTERAQGYRLTINGQGARAFSRERGPCRTPFPGIDLP
jgi:2-polyprenyl-6-methoxyphenol hydroxylase-like FAD-dependent oxidoreductase